MVTIKLIVGLGNPGPQYAHTRHNVGCWLIESLIIAAQSQLNTEKKFFGLHGTIQLEGKKCHVLIPTTFMNHSGRAVYAIKSYYKIETEEILIAHDDLDIPVGCVKLKFGGGHGGHNGLRNITEQLASNNFHRLRIGIGHPGDRNHVLDYVLGNPSISDADKIKESIAQAVSVLPIITRGEIQKAMNTLHSSNQKK